MFTFEPGVAVWSLIAFSLVVVFMQRVIYPKIRKVLDDRQKIIDEALAEAQTNRTEAKKMRDEAEEKLRNINLEAHQIISAAKTKAIELKQEYEKKAVNEYRDLRKSKKEELQKLEEDFINTSEDSLAALIIRACEKTIKTKLTPEQHQEIINNRIQELKTLKEI